MAAKKSKNINGLNISKAHIKLDDESDRALNRIKNKGWIIEYEFTKSHRFLDKHGVDLVIYFSYDGNGGHGSVLVQEKRNKRKKIKEHFKKYPCVPCYLLFTSDNAKEVEYTFLLLILKCHAYNSSKREKIRRRIKTLEKKVGKQEYRVFCDVCEFGLRKSK